MARPKRTLTRTPQVLAATATGTAIASPAPWPGVLATFLAAKVDSPHTHRAYERHIRGCLEGLGKRTLAEITGQDLAHFRAELVADGRGPATHGQALSALRSFLKWAGIFGAHGIPSVVIGEALRTPKTEVRKPYQVLSEEEIVRVLQATATRRDKAILGVFLGAGLRVAELAALDVAAMTADTAGITLLHVRGKGRKERIVPIRPEVAGWIRSYLVEGGRNLGEPGPLFRAYDRPTQERRRPPSRRPRRKHGRLSTAAVAALVARTIQRAGIDAKRISPHSLRHTMALRTLRVRRDPVAVQKLLGHAALQTTMRYVDHLELPELLETVPELPQG